MILIAEWIEGKKAFRVYDRDEPNYAIAYVNDVEVARRYALDHGYDGIIIER